MGKYFGTDGFRGEANKDLNFEHAVKIGRFLGWYYGARQGKKAKIVIGKDTRRSSYMFEYALCTGLMASGADAYIMHVTTTPSVAYIARVDDFDCGIMISASHNPFYDNGIKLLNGNGEKMDEETILTAAARTFSHLPVRLLMAHSFSVFSADKPPSAAHFCSSRVLLLRMQSSRRGRRYSGAPTASNSPATKPMWLTSIKYSQPVNSRLSVARDMVWAVTSSSTAPMHSTPIWLISWKVWLS